MATQGEMKVLKLFTTGSGMLDTPTRMPDKEIIKEVEGHEGTDPMWIHLETIDTLDLPAKFGFKREAIVGYSIFKPSSRMVQPPGPSLMGH